MRAKKFILIVDDDIDDAQLLTEAIYQSTADYICIAVSNGEEALEFLKNNINKPDFIFLDLNMPKVNGRECLTRIKSSLQLKHIPVIIYSTTTQKKEKQELLELGADYFVSKPYNFSLLVDAVSDIILTRPEAVQR